MNILETLIKLRDDLKLWVANNIDSLNDKIENKAKTRFSRDYHDLFNAPKITDDEKKELAIADEEGNIIFKIDKDGAHTTGLTLKGKQAATKQYVNSAIQNIIFPEPDLSNYTTKQEVAEAIEGIVFPKPDLAGYATEEFVDEKVADLIDSAPEALNTLGELAAGMKEHEDAYDALLETVGKKATHKEVEDLEKALNNGATSEAEEYCIADNDGNVIFKVDKDGVATTAVKTKTLTVDNKDIHQHIKEAIDKIEFPETDLAGYATEDFVEEAIKNIDFPETDLTDYATEEYVKNKIAEAKLEGEDIDLSGYATKSDLNGFIKEIPAEYVNEQELGEVIEQTKRDLGENTSSSAEEFQIADEEGNVIVRVNKDGVHTTNLTFGGGVAATQEFVNEAIENIQFPETDLSNYPTKEEVQQAIADIDFPETDLTDYATKKFVGEEIAKIEFPETDLTGYATEQFVKDEVADLVNSAPEALDTLGELATAMKEKGDAIEALELIAGSKAAQTDLDETNQQLGAVKELVGTTSVESQIEEALDNFETFSGDYKDLVNAPDIAEDGSGDMAVADKDGNVAFKVDSEGRTHVTSLAIDGENLESILEKKATKEEITLTTLGLTYGKSDLTPGVSPLPTGHFYFVYE